MCVQMRATTGRNLLACVRSQQVSCPETEQTCGNREFLAPKRTMKLPSYAATARALSPVGHVTCSL